VHDEEEEEEEKERCRGKERGDVTCGGSGGKTKTFLARVTEADDDGLEAWRRLRGPLRITTAVNTRAKGEKSHTKGRTWGERRVQKRLAPPFGAQRPLACRVVPLRSERRRQSLLRHAA